MKASILATSLVMLIPPLHAQGTPNYWVGIQGGEDWQLTRARNAKNNGVLGIMAGTWCTPRWGGDLSVLGTSLSSKSFDAMGPEWHTHVSALFNLAPDQTAWTPYLRAGLGTTWVDYPFSSHTFGGTTRFSYNGGIGIQAAPREHILVGLEARAIRVQTQIASTELLGLVTVGYRWGGSAKVPVTTEPVVAPAPAPAPAAPDPTPAAEPAPAPVAIAPAPQPVQSAPQPMPARIVLDEAVLHFANGKSKLPPAGLKAIDKVATSLLAFPGEYTLVVTGHTSSVGKPAFNRALSKRRADAVAAELTAAGIPADSIQAVGAGPDRPVATNKTAKGQARNRRVEIEIKAEGHPVETRKTVTDTIDE